MTKGTVKTQGTELFVADNATTSETEIVKLACPTGINGLGGAADQIESTCLDTVDDKEFVGGLGNPGQVEVPFNFIPSAGSQQRLFELKASRETVSWLIGLSDGVDLPELDTDGGWIAPTDRTSIEFNAYIADLNIDIATNEIVRGTLTLQRSGAVVPHFNGPVPV